jgi:hypothetical protein
VRRSSGTRRSVLVIFILAHVLIVVKVALREELRARVSRRGMMQEELGSEGVVVSKGPVERCLEVAVEGLRRSTTQEEHGNDVEACTSDSKVEGCFAVYVAGVDAGASVDEEVSKREETFHASQVQGCVSARGAFVGVGAFVQEAAHCVNVLTND